MSTEAVKRQIVAELQLLALAFQFMTALPVRAPLSPTEMQVGQCIRYFPICGFVLGCITAIAGSILYHLLPAGVVAAILVILLALLTGGLHLDGLADACDGLPLPGNREDRLAIMRRSDIGSRGATGMVFLLLLKWVILAALLPAQFLPALPVALALARWTSVPAIVLFPYVRPHGMSAAFKRYGGVPELAISSGIAMLPAFSLWGSNAVWAFALAAVAITVAGKLALLRLGGMTGDIYGALNECTEVLLAACWLIIATHA